MSQPPALRGLMGRAGSSKLEGPEQSNLVLELLLTVLLLLLLFVLAEEDELVLKARILGGVSLPLPPDSSCWG